MSVSDEGLVIEETSLELDEKPGLSPWWIAGALLFAIAFFVGWRSARKPRPGDAASGTKPVA